jgi:putative molybdopterin biosynthesis protein
MDGFAVKAESTFGASEIHPRELALGVDAFLVNPGHVIPEGTNAVIMIEHVRFLDDKRLQIEAPAFPWQYIRKMGEDIVATEMLFARNHKMTPYDVGALLAGGVFEVAVRCRPRVLIIPTGSELVNWQEARPDALLERLKPGQVLESNAYVMGGLIESCGGTYERHDLVHDDVDTIRQCVEAASRQDVDMVLIIGGSSAGSQDYAATVIDSLGEILVHGVTIMPGKPVIIGDVGSTPVFGLPGYPVSGIVAFEQFVRPLLLNMLGQPDERRETIEVEPVRKLPSKLGIEEFLRVKIGAVGERVVAIPLPRGSGSITSITEADGIIRIPHHVEGLNAGESVTAELLRPRASIHNTIVTVGSHDNTLDVLADELKGHHAHVTFSSSHVGSMGGLMAIKKGACHVAGIHLLDTQDGSYNISYIKKYLGDMKVRLIHLVLRDQGLMIPAGNPKHIKGIEDLGRDDVMFINRQGGSGTRILLDYRLQQLGIKPEMVNGYGNEEFTHMSIAVAVLSGSADAGLGIYAAARALHLDFIPVVTEQYDLVIPEVYFETPKIQTLLDVIHSERFKKRVEALGGYHTEKTGTVKKLFL